MRLPRSLLGQIIAANIVTLIGAALLVPLGSTVLLQRIAAHYQRFALEAQADGIADELGDSAAGVMPNGLGSAYANPFGGHFFAVLDDRGGVLIDGHEPKAILTHAGRTTRQAFFRDGDSYTLVSRANIHGRWLRIVTTHDMRSPGAITDDVVRDFVSVFLLILAPILILLMLCSMLLAHRTTAAIRAEASVADTIGPEMPARRVRADRLPSEVAPLAAAMNGALDRLENSVRSRNEFVGNVAHELRTPLATIKLGLDEVPDADLRHRLTRLVDRAGHVVAQLFELATLEQLDGALNEVFDLGEAAQTAVDGALPAIIARGDSVAFDACATPVRVWGRRELAVRAIANLIDNAVRHTPVETAITVAVGRGGSVTVADDGPGMASADIGHATERYWRKDHSRSDRAGLGLAIVKRVMSAMGGSLTIANRPEGGALITLKFPVGDHVRATKRDYATLHRHPGLDPGSSFFS
ncbi:sensor histidine kinase [Sphingomonas tabacisoli]|uniref:histidine kinase n=1 Tax=Sphingomonas tabacisoli TaxID=2249466 RepID=A0ABW4I269_9SPHN